MSASAATISRIQFRLPSGNPYIGQFEPTSTLRDLRNYVVENINVPFHQFAMSTSFPRRELTQEEDEKTLLELELVPTAVILILPLTNVISMYSLIKCFHFNWEREEIHQGSPEFMISAERHNNSHIHTRCRPYTTVSTVYDRNLHSRILLCTRLLYWRCTRRHAKTTEHC